MVSKSSISVQSLGKIALRAGCRCENMVFVICCLSQKPARCDAFEVIIIRRGIVALFIGRFGFCFHIYFRRDCLFSCTRECPFPSPVEATIFQKLTETFLRTTSCRQLRDLKNTTAILYSLERCCAPIHFFPRSTRGICQNSYRQCKNGSERTSLCAEKSHTESLPQYLCVVVHARDVVVHTYCGFYVRHQMAPQQSAEFRTANFRQFCSTLRKDSFANYGSTWTLFPPSVRGVLCNSLNVLQFHQQVAAEHSQSCGGKFTKRKNWPQCLCQIFPMIIIEIAINSTRGRLTLYPAGMHCSRWRDDAFGFQFVLK